MEKRSRTAEADGLPVGPEMIDILFFKFQDLGKGAFLEAQEIVTNETEIDHCRIIGGMKNKGNVEIRDKLK